jgi:hypothetical protein
LTFAGIAAVSVVGLAIVAGDNEEPAASSSVAADEVGVAPRSAAAALLVVQEAQPQSPVAADPELRRRIEPPPQAERLVVTAAPSGANMRAMPSLAGAVLWKAPNGTPLRVTEEEGNWLRVATHSGARAGWMHRSVLSD